MLAHGATRLGAFANQSEDRDTAGGNYAKTRRQSSSSDRCWPGHRWRNRPRLWQLKAPKVVVNDLGGNTDGTGTGKIADDVVAEIRAAGGEAVSNTDSVAEVGVAGLRKTALDSFGGMDILVNNAGILRDRTIFKMEESDWDAVLAVHLKGHYCCTGHLPTTYATKPYRRPYY